MSPIMSLKDSFLSLYWGLSLDYRDVLHERLPNIVQASTWSLLAHRRLRTLSASALPCPCSRNLVTSVGLCNEGTVIPWLPLSQTQVVPHVFVCLLDHLFSTPSFYCVFPSLSPFPQPTKAKQSQATPCPRMLQMFPKQ